MRAFLAFVILFLATATGIYAIFGDDRKCVASKDEVQLIFVPDANNGMTMMPVMQSVCIEYEDVRR